MPEPGGSGTGILALAGALPAEIRTNDYWGEEFRASYDEKARRDITTAANHVSAPEDIDPEVARNAEQTRADLFKGTKERRVLSSELSTADLEVAAGRAALDAAGMRPEDIDVFILYSVLPDQIIPLTHANVASRLGLRADVIAMSLAAGCGSWPLQMATANAMLANTNKRALLIQSAVMSRLNDYSSPNSVNGGDGAMATILGPVSSGKGFVDYKQHTKGELHAGVRAYSREAPEVPWYETHRHRGALKIYGDDAKAARIMGGRAASFCRETCGALLEDNGTTAADIDFFVISQPTAWFGAACCDAMGISRDKTTNTFARLAHIMAASAPMNLMTAHREGRLEDDDLVLVYSPGAGFVQNALLLRWQACPTAIVEIGEDQRDRSAI